MEPWAGFFEASAGAAATLSGMLAVAISINLSRILSFPSLPNRAAGALIPLAGVLALSLLVLIPAQPRALLGAEVLATAVLVWGLEAALLLRSRATPTAAEHTSPTWPRVLLAQLQTIPLVIAGALMALNHPAAAYWLAPGVIFSLLVGIVNTWVLLIEILR